MGGLGSGKWRRPGRKTVDSYPALDANYLSIKGWLQPGRSGVFLGSGPNSEVIQISLRAEVDHLCLSWRVANTSSNTSNTGSSDGSSSEFSGAYFGFGYLNWPPRFSCPSPGSLRGIDVRR